MDDFSELTGRLWNDAREMLRERGFSLEGSQAVQVLDITPERAPRTPQQTFGWGQHRVVRVATNSAAVVVTIAREMSLA